MIFIGIVLNIGKVVIMENEFQLLSPEQSVNVLLPELIDAYMTKATYKLLITIFRCTVYYHGTKARFDFLGFNRN